MRVREAAIAAIRARFPETAVPSVKKHRGRWSQKSISRDTKKTPCIMVAYTGAQNFDTTGAGTSRGEVTFTAFVMADAKGAGPGEADDAALAITTELLRILPGSAFYPDAASAADNVDGINAYVDALEDLGYDIHAVSWQQEVALPKMSAEELAALPDFLRLFSTFEMGGEDDPDAEHMNNVREP